MSREESEASTDGRDARALLALALGLGLLLFSETLLRALGYVDVRETTLVLSEEYLIGVFTTIPFVLGIGYGAIRLLQETEGKRGSHRVLKWALAAAGVSVLINGLVILVTPAVSRWYILAWLRWAVAIGGGVGVLVGFLEQRAIQNAREAERARVKAEQIERQRDTLDYLNSLLRHEVLNGINVIEGHSQLVAEKTSDPDLAERHIQPIVRRSHDIASVISDVRTLMQVIEGTNDFTVINLNSTIDREVAKVRDTAPEAEISVTLPEVAYVESDDLIGRTYGNVLFNAVEHNDSDPPRITVEGWQSEGDFVVEISDNGPGIGETAQAKLFERPSSGPADHGFGLYIVDQLCEHSGGTIELAETGPEGSTFRITLPAASPPAESEIGSPFVGVSGGQTSSPIWTS